MSTKLEDLLVWHDPTPHLGETNMMIDAHLLEHIGETPILRLYEWSEPTVTYGYFSDPVEARSRFGNKVTYVRRRTGGGIVDHRNDLTYTLILPKSNPWAQLKGSASYAIIHCAVTHALNLAGVTCQLIEEDSGNGDTACFVNPVAFDIVNPKGNKLAGAGQRRSKYGLLHQGSILADITIDSFIEPLCQSLATSYEFFRPQLPAEIEN